MTRRFQVASILLATLGAACVGDAAVVNNSVDSGADAATIPDAGADGTTDAGTTFCATQTGNVVLCEDFDQGDLAGRGWGNDPLLVPPAPTTVTTPVKSSPFAFFSTSTTPPSGGVWARMTRTVNVGAATKKAIIEADLLMDQAVFLGGAGQVVPFSMALNTAPTPTAIAIVVKESTWGCFGAGSVPGVDANEAFALKTWHHMKMVADFGPTTFTLTCSVDSKSVVVTGAGAGASAPSADRRVAIGHNAGGNLGKVDVYTDNVVVRAE